MAYGVGSPPTIEAREGHVSRPIAGDAKPSDREWHLHPGEPEQGHGKDPDRRRQIPPWEGRRARRRRGGYCVGTHRQQPAGVSCRSADEGTLTYGTSRACVRGPASITAARRSPAARAEDSACCSCRTGTFDRTAGHCATRIRNRRSATRSPAGTAYHKGTSAASIGSNAHRTDRRRRRPPRDLAIPSPSFVRPSTVRRSFRQIQARRSSPCGTIRKRAFCRSLLNHVVASCQQRSR